MKRTYLFILLLALLVAPALADDSVFPSDDIIVIVRAPEIGLPGETVCANSFAEVKDSIDITTDEGCQITALGLSSGTDGTYNIVLTRASGATITGKVIQSRYMIIGVDHRFELDGKWFNSTIWGPWGYGQITISEALKRNTTLFYLLGRKGYDNSRRLEIETDSFLEDPILSANIDLVGGGGFLYRVSRESDTQRISSIAYTTGDESIIETIQNYFQFGWEVVQTFLAIGYWLIYGLGLIWIMMILEMGMAAYYVNTSKDIFQFYKKFAAGNRAFFEFISGMLHVISQIAVNIKNTIPFLRWL